MKRLLGIILFLTASVAHGATRVKTVEYAFQHSSETVASAAVRSYAPITVYIPELTGRRFKSVFTVADVHENGTTAVNATAFLTGVGINALTVSSVTFSDTMTNSGENVGYVFVGSFTAYFQSNFVGSSETVKANTVLTGPGSNNTSLKLVITYEYDDSATTRIKTVRIPIQSSTSTIPTTLTEIGTNQIPNLNNFLPEASKVFRDIFFEIYNVEGTITAFGTDPQMSVALDNEGAWQDSPHVDTLVSDRAYKWIWKRTNMATDREHSFKAATTALSMPFNVTGAILNVTYEYDHSTSTSVINSVILSAADENGYSGGTTELDASLFSREIIINEPGPITLKQSGVLFSGTAGGTVTNILKTPLQAGTTYLYAVNTVNAGSRNIVHRIDLENGFSLARGTNTFDLIWWRTAGTTSNMTSIPSAVLYLNYTSGISTMGGGEANHLHTVFDLLAPASNDVSLLEVASSFSIPETYWWQSSAGMFAWYGNIGGGGGTSGLAIKAEIKPGEWRSNGWDDIFTGLFAMDPEYGYSLLLPRSGKNYKKHPGDPDTNKLNPLTTRNLRFESSQSSYYQAASFLTYRTSTVTVTGTIYNYNGNGSGITVKLFDSNDHEHIGTVTTSAGGTFSFVWYDDTNPIYGQAYQSELKFGRSADIIPGSTPVNIYMIPGLQTGSLSNSAGSGSVTME